MKERVVWICLLLAAVSMVSAAPLRVLRPQPVGRQLAPAEVQGAAGKVVEPGRVPLALDDYCVYSLPVRGTGPINVVIESEPHDVALEMRLFAPGSQAIVASAKGYGKVELSAAATIRIVTPDAPTGDWMIEVRCVELPRPVVRPLAGATMTVRRDAGTTHHVTAPAGIGPASDAQTPAERLAPAKMTGRLVIKPRQPRINGTLTARWPGMGQGEIVNVTARREFLRRRMAADRAEMDLLRHWQLQWDEAAKAYLVATLAQKDLEGLRSSLQDAIDSLKSAGRDRQDYDTMFENFDQKAQQLMNELSQILKNMQETRASIARNML